MVPSHLLLNLSGGGGAASRLRSVLRGQVGGPGHPPRFVQQHASAGASPWLHRGGDLRPLLRGIRPGLKWFLAVREPGCHTSWRTADDGWLSRLSAQHRHATSYVGQLVADIGRPFKFVLESLDRFWSCEQAPTSASARSDGIGSYHWP